MNTTENNKLLREAFLESWIGFMALSSYVTAAILGANQIVLGGLAVVSAVLFMNGFAKTELFLTAKGPDWWRHNPSISWFHHISQEGELAGILIGIMLFISMSMREHSPHFHLPIAGALTLVGIMSSAGLAVKRVVPIMALIEKHFGSQVAIFFGALLSSLTGAAASVFVCEYFKDRINPNNKADFAVKFAAALGLGNGLFPFASPPILIVWGVLQTKLGWHISTLFFLVGLPAIIYAFLITIHINKLLDNNLIANEHARPKLDILLPLLGIVVLANIIDYESAFTMLLNISAGIFASIKSKDLHEKTSAWILGLLLIALELIGTEANAFVDWLANTLIPSGVSVLVLGLLLFYITAFISHFADNALASKLVLSAALASPLFSSHGDFLAIAVILGALAGGFALIPANLPNFPIARILSVTPGAWSKSALKIYYSMLFFVAWISVFYIATSFYYH